MLKVNKKLYELGLGNGSITNIGANFLYEALEFNHSLKILNIHNNIISFDF